MQRFKFSILMVVVFALAIGVLVNKKMLYSYVFKSRNSQPDVKLENTTGQNEVKVVAKDLEVPWEIVFIDETTFLVTQRGGKLSKVEMAENAQSIISDIDGVYSKGEGGLLGMAIDPEFKKNRKLYLYSTTKNDKGIENRVESYEFDGTKIWNRQVILSGIKGSSNHDGGRIAFGPDGYLYVTTGDAENSKFAQDKKSLNGKILRVKPDGSIPADNPFGNAVYSYGHRNPQGLTWDTAGNLWSTEHGPSGAQTGYDEVNLINKGSNYGWPNIKGTETKENMLSPILQSGAEDTWAPGQIVFYNNDLFWVGLRGSALYQAHISNNKLVDLKQHFKNTYGRLRTITLGPDGYFYISTSNRDGRGSAKPEDDKILRINPDMFF